MLRSESIKRVECRAESEAGASPTRFFFFLCVSLMLYWDLLIENISLTA